MRASARKIYRGGRCGRERPAEVGGGGQEARGRGEAPPVAYDGGGRTNRIAFPNQGRLNGKNTYVVEIG